MKNFKSKFVFFLLLTTFLFDCQQVEAKWGGFKKYTFVLVHGSWHGDWAWYLTQTALEQKGHKVISVNLKGHGTDCTDIKSITLGDYESDVIEVLDKLPGKVVLVGHSFGGVVISSVAEKRPEKIDKLIYLAAFLLKNGQSSIDIASLDEKSLVMPSINIDFENNKVSFKEDVDLTTLFYQNSNPESVTLARNVLVSEPFLPLITPITTTKRNFGNLKKYYIQTLNDKAISPKIQELMYTETPVDKVFPIYGDHSPFFGESTRFKLEELLVEIANTDRKHQSHKGNQSEETIDKWVKISPQPFKDKIVISCLGRRLAVGASITDLMGNQILKETFSKGKESISLDLSALKEKVYFLTVWGEDGFCHKQRILK